MILLPLLPKLIFQTPENPPNILDFRRGINHVAFIVRYLAIQLKSASKQTQIWKDLYALIAILLATLLIDVTSSMATY